MTDNADIRRMFEQVAQQNHELRRRIEKLENAPADLRNAAIDGGKGLLVKSGDETVRLGDNGIEHQGGPTPFPPAPPFVDAGGETVKIQHSGLDVYENIAPRDFRRAQVHVAQTETFEPSLSTLAGFIDPPNGGMTHRLPGGEWYVGVVWETRSGKLSDLSETVLADVAPLVDADEIQEALDEAAERLEEAEKDFQEGNEQRKQEIENLRDTVIPGLESQLSGKADQSALDDLDDKIDNIDIPDLSGVPTKDQVDEAVRAAEQAAREHADLVSKGAKDDAIAEAERKADAAKEAAETAAKEYADQQSAAVKREAAQDAQAKADAAREHADKLVGELDFSDFAHVWQQADPPPAGTTYEWTDGAHASPSVNRVGGEIVARNLMPSPRYIDDSYSTSNVDIEPSDGQTLNRITTTGDGTSYTGKTQFDVVPGQWFGSALSFEWGEGIGRVRHQVQFRGPDNESIDAPQHQNDRSDHPDGGRSIVAWEVPDGATEARLYSWYYLEGTFTTAPEGSTVYIGEYSVTVADSEDAALEQVATYFDGDTPDSRERDLWIDKSGLPHFWKKGWGWAVLDDERISRALNDAEKAQKRADEAHEEAGEAKDSAAAAMDRAGAAEDYADGLPKVLHGTSAPSGTAPDESTWFQHQDDLSGPVIGQWTMVDGSWKSTEIASEAIANLDVGKLTAGSAEVAEGVFGKLWASDVAVENLEAVEGWIGGVALEDGAVGAKQVNVENLFANEAVIDKVWTDIVRARMLTAEEAFIGGALIKDNTIDVEKINVTEELTAAIAQFLKVKADMLEANAIDGMTITGSTLQTRPETEQGIKLRAAQNDLVAYDQDGKQRVHIDGTTGHITAHNGEFRDGSVIGSSVIGGYVGTASTGKRVYMEGENLTARDTNNDITAQLGPSGLALRDAGGTLQNIGNHIYGAEQFTAASGMNRGVTVNSANSANTWGSWVYGYLSKSSVITSNRYRVDVTFIIDGYARAAGAQTAVRFMVQPTDMNENLVDPRMSLFDRSIYTGDPLFAVPRSFTLTGTVTLNEAWPVGTPYRVRYAARTQNFDGTVRINNISIMMQPI